MNQLPIPLCCIFGILTTLTITSVLFFLCTSIPDQLIFGKEIGFVNLIEEALGCAKCKLSLWIFIGGEIMSGLCISSGSIFPIPIPHFFSFLVFCKISCLSNGSGPGPWCEPERDPKSNYEWNSTTRIFMDSIFFIDINFHINTTETSSFFVQKIVHNKWKIAYKSQHKIYEGLNF